MIRFGSPSRLGTKTSRGFASPCAGYRRGRLGTLLAAWIMTGAVSLHSISHVHVDSVVHESCFEHHEPIHGRVCHGADELASAEEIKDHTRRFAAWHQGQDPDHAHCLLAALGGEPTPSPTGHFVPVVWFDVKASVPIPTTDSRSSDPTILLLAPKHSPPLLAPMDRNRPDDDLL